jgi:transcriptional regulator with XRE-family HTH domain
MTCLGQQVQSRRESKGWSRAQLALKCDLSENGLRMLETGQRPDPRASTVCKLAGALGVTPDVLLLPTCIAWRPVGTDWYVPGTVL